MQAQGEQPPGQADARAREGHDQGALAETVEDDDDHGPRQGGDGVELAPEDLGHPVGQEVAGDAAADGGDQAHQRGRDGAQAVLQGLQRAGDAEQRQPEGVGSNS